VSENQGQEAVEEVKYAGFWIRVVATLIDGMLLWPITWLVRHILPNGWFDVVMWLFDAGFYIWFVSSKYQGTPGKILLKLKVTDLEGNRISILRSVKRFMFYQICILIECSFIYLVEISDLAASHELTDIMIGLVGVALGIIAAFTIIVGYLMVAFTKRSQGLHDKIASTLVVVRGNKPI